MFFLKKQCNVKKGLLVKGSILHVIFIFENFVR